MSARSSSRSAIMLRRNANRHPLCSDRLHFMGPVSDLFQGAAKRLSLGDSVASHSLGIRLFADRAHGAAAMVLAGQGRAPAEGAGRLYRQRGAAVGQLVHLYLV